MADGQIARAREDQVLPFITAVRQGFESAGRVMPTQGHGMAKENVAGEGVHPFLAAEMVSAVADLRVMITAVHPPDGPC